jgi:hypothetical protein
MEMALNLDNLKDMIHSTFTPEYFKKLAEKCYQEDREYPENFSNWYYHIKDFGEFKHADIISNQIFTLEEVETLQETDNIKMVNWDKIKDVLKPTISLMEGHKLYSIKNGSFSNKFEFKTSISNKYDLAEQFWKINYQSALFGAGGYTEIVVRELIPDTISGTIPTIYGGMPLREEVRVFYNLDTSEIEYMVDYWDYDYCRPNIHNVNDKIIFDYFHNKIGSREINHTEYLNNILMKAIREKIKSLKFDDVLKGIWSIDFLCLDKDNIYLIDMARGFRSAYWDEGKCKCYES